MSYKPKKINKNKVKKEKDPNKFHLGWNTGTYLIIIGSVIGLVLIYLIFHFTLISENSYYRLYNDHIVTPYTDKEGTEDSDKKFTSYSDYTLVEAKDFDKLNIDLYCTSFDSNDAHSATFDLTITSNENTGNLATINKMFVQTNTGSNVVYARLCLAANWIGFEKYSSDPTSLTKSNITETTKSPRTIKVDLGDVKFPTKANTWPVPVGINYPDAYLFVCFQNSNKSAVEKYVIHFTEADFIVKQATETRKITSPAH